MRKSDRIYAVAGALLVHAALLLTLLYTFLTYPPKDVKEWPPQPEHEIVIEEVDPLYASGEFVRTGDNLEEILPPGEVAPSTVESKEPTQDAADVQNAGVAAEQNKVTTTERESASKVEKKKQGPTKEELQREKERQEARRQQQAKKNVAEATRKAFGGGKGKSASGSVEGNSKTGNITGTPGNGLRGRTLESFGRVASTKIGKIAVRVTVDSKGKVISARYDAGASSGPVAADASMRNRCVQRSRECRFSVLEDSPRQSGIITWVFE